MIKTYTGRRSRDLAARVPPHEQLQKRSTTSPSVSQPTSTRCVAAPGFVAKQRRSASVAKATPSLSLLLDPNAGEWGIRAALALARDEVHER